MEKQREEEFKVEGEELLKRVKELIKQGNIRRITIKTKEGKSIIEIPLTIGVVGAVLLPVFAAVSAVAALVTECTISIEREVEDDDKSKK
ncbi:MAG: DUF4342 domain-containing protein [Candidatus Saccharibacteria bacterium]